MIYTVPLTNNQVDENGLPYDLRTNSERYPLKEIISQDMTSFIVTNWCSHFSLGFIGDGIQRMQKGTAERPAVAEILRLNQEEPPDGRLNSRYAQVLISGRL